MNISYKIGLRLFVLILPVLFTISGCSHTVKMYEGNERDLSQLAAIYLDAGNDPVGVGYLNDKWVPRRTNRAVVHILPGNNKLTLVYVNRTQEGRIITSVYNMYSVQIDLRAGYSYIAWTGSHRSQPPSEACMFEYSHADFEKLYEGNPHSITSPLSGRKVSCGNMINAKEYVKLHRMK